MYLVQKEYHTLLQMDEQVAHFTQVLDALPTYTVVYWLIDLDAIKIPP